MITIRQAFKIRAQIILGEWSAPVYQKYSYDPLDLECYDLVRGDFSIWVGNGFFSLRLKKGSHDLEISFICKLVIYNAAMSERYKAINGELSKRKDKLKLELHTICGGE